MHPSDEHPRGSRAKPPLHHHTHVAPRRLQAHLIDVSSGRLPTGVTPLGAHATPPRALYLLVHPFAPTPRGAHATPPLHQYIHTAPSRLLADLFGITRRWAHATPQLLQDTHDDPRRLQVHLIGVSPRGGPCYAFSLPAYPRLHQSSVYLLVHPFGETPRTAYTAPPIHQHTHAGSGRLQANPFCTTEQGVNATPQLLQDNHATPSRLQVPLISLSPEGSPCHAPFPSTPTLPPAPYRRSHLIQLQEGGMPRLNSTSTPTAHLQKHTNVAPTPSRGIPPIGVSPGSALCNASPPRARPGRPTPLPTTTLLQPLVSACRSSRMGTPHLLSTGKSVPKSLPTTKLIPPFALALGTSAGTCRTPAPPV